MVTGSSRGAPVHRMAWAGIAMAVVAGGLALYCSMHAEKHIAGSPLREARGSAGLPSRPETRPGRFLARAETSVFGDDIDRKMLSITERSKIANYSLQLVAYVLPFALGL